MVLQSIRERLTGILAFFILGILVIPFAFVGVNSYFDGGTQNLVARVNDQDITFNDFNQSFIDYRRRMQSIMGERFDIREFDSEIARREHLDRMIDEALMAQAADSGGFEVDDDRLAQTIREIPAFQVDGVFNQDVYAARLTAQGLSPRQFQDEMRAQIAISQLPQALTLSSFATNRELAEFVALQEQTRTFRAVVIPADTGSSDVAFSEDEIVAWYEANQSDFQTEEQVRIEYLELSAIEAATVEVPDDDFLRERFEQQKGRFIAPEKRLVSHILFEVTPDADDVTRQTARQQAEDIAARARGGEDFAELAVQFSQDPGSAANGGDLGWMEPGIMVDAFETAMYDLTLESPVSDPVQTGFGWHVIKLREIEPASGMSFEEARQTLIDEHHEEEAEREYLDLADRLVDIIYEDPTTLEGAALDLGLEIQSAGPFGRNGGEGLAANPEIVNTAFSEMVLLQGSVSDPVDLGPNHMVMLRVAEHFPASVKPLEEVREAVITGLRQERAYQAALAQANELLEQLNSGAADLESLAQDRGLEVQVAENALRRNFVPDPQIVAGVFKLSKPQGDDPVYAIVEAPAGPAVVALDSVTDGRLEEGAVIGAQQFRRQLANASASYEAWALLQQLRAQAEIDVFEDNLGVTR